MLYSVDIHDTAVKKNILIFIIGVLSVIKIRVLGTFAVSEVLALCFLPFMPVAECVRNRKLLMFVIMAFLWLVGLVIADIVNESSIENSMKGAFSIIFLIGSIPFVYWLLNDDIRRILYFWSGVAVSSVLLLYFPVGYINNTDNLDYFRIYNILPLALASGGILYYKGYKYSSYILCLGFGVFALFQESRHIFLLMNIAVVLAFVYNILHGKLQGHSGRYNLRFLGGALLLTGIVIGLSAGIYSGLASRGYMGERARAKYELQSSSNIGLLSGRRDFLISLYAGWCNPWIGYGSYAEDEYDFTAKVINSIEEPEEAPRYMSGWPSSKLIRTHSHILGAWVHGGILGLLFWIYVLMTIALFVRKGIVSSGRLYFFYVLLTAFMVWDILFSPFANRMQFVVYFVSILIVLQSCQHKVGRESQNIVISCG